MTDKRAINAIKESKPLRLFDVIVMAVVTVAALALALTGLVGGKKGARVVVTENGKTQEYSLGENREIKLTELTVVIDGGEAYVKDASCADKVCEHTGRISRVNQSIVCLPGGVVVKIVGSGEFQADTGQAR